MGGLVAVSRPLTMWQGDIERGALEPDMSRAGCAHLTCQQVRRRVLRQADAGGYRSVGSAAGVGAGRWQTDRGHQSGGDDEGRSVPTAYRGGQLQAACNGAREHRQGCR